jgi:beta-mannosidase
MWGAPRERWAPRLFHEIVPALLAEIHCHLPYWPSSAHGGAFPHQVNQGTASYYGVGAYLRPIEDARRSSLRFATECLGFANVPDEQTLAAISPGTMLPTHHPLWKSRVPRDLGAGWDFEDVRDHYFEQLVGTSPLTVRYQDSFRYLELSRVVSAEVMAAAFREWRRQESTCRGALVWFFRDLWPSAGWGIIDALGHPKAAYYLLRHRLQPRAVFFADEGTNGLYVHVLNEAATPLRATLTLGVYRRDGNSLSTHSRPVDLQARGSQVIAAVECLPGFEDLNHAYRFAACAHESVVATLRDPTGHVIAEDFFFPSGSLRFVNADPGLDARARRAADGKFKLSLLSRGCARFVTIRAPGFVADDQYFHLAPGVERTVTVSPVGDQTNLRGTVAALNGTGETRIEIEP